MSEKIKAIYHLILYFVRSYPQRLKRVLLFLLQKENYSRSLFLLEWTLLLLDLLGIPEILQILHELFYWNLRGLTEQEMNFSEPIFKNCIHWKNIRLHGKNMICKKYHFAFVSFHTIHFYSNISDYILIHELVHVWQYEKYGSAYLVRALHAQRTREGYDYGGEMSLYDNNHLLDFNFEQMAEIIKDGYLNGSTSSIYKNYIKQLQE